MSMFWHNMRHRNMTCLMSLFVLPYWQRRDIGCLAKNDN